MDTQPLLDRKLAYLMLPFDARIEHSNEEDGSTKFLQECPLVRINGQG